MVLLVKSYLNPLPHSRILYHILLYCFFLLLYVLFIFLLFLYSIVIHMSCYMI